MVGFGVFFANRLKTLSERNNVKFLEVCSHNTNIAQL